MERGGGRRRALAAGAARAAAAAAAAFAAARPSRLARAAPLGVERVVEANHLRQFVLARGLVPRALAVPHEKDTLATPGKDGGAGGGGGEEVETRREAFRGTRARVSVAGGPPPGSALTSVIARRFLWRGTRTDAPSGGSAASATHARDDAALDRMSIDRVRGSRRSPPREARPLPSARTGRDHARCARRVRTNARGGTRASACARGAAAPRPERSRRARTRTRGARRARARSARARSDAPRALPRTRRRQGDGTRDAARPRIHRVVMLELAPCGKGAVRSLRGRAHRGAPGLVEALHGTRSSRGGAVSRDARATPCPVP